MTQIVQTKKTVSHRKAAICEECDSCNMYDVTLDTFECEDCSSEMKFKIAERIKQCGGCNEFHNVNNPAYCFSCAVGL